MVAVSGAQASVFSAPQQSSVTTRPKTDLASVAREVRRGRPRAVVAGDLPQQDIDGCFVVGRERAAEMLDLGLRTFDRYIDQGLIEPMRPGKFLVEDVYRLALKLRDAA